MIALPFQPSNAFPIAESQENMEDMLHMVEQNTRDQLGIEPPAPLSAKIHLAGRFAP